jgi:glycosyltransferase involved in cell wall biosynthesis
MKCCFISQGFGAVDVLEGDTRRAGGSETQVAYLAAAFAKLGHTVDLIYGSGQGRHALHMIAGIRCIDSFPAWSLPGSLLGFWKSLRESRADLIYARMPSDFHWMIELHARLEKKAAFVYAISNDRSCNPWRTYPSSPGRWFHNLCYALWLPTTKLITIQHPEQAQMIKPYIKGRLFLVPNLMNSVESEPRDYDSTTVDVIWIAQIRRQKQLSVLLDIAEDLSSLRFVIVGGFPAAADQSKFEGRIQSIRNLQFMGPRQSNEVMQLLKSSKILINTSCWEGFPNTMLEAWSVGVPVVSLEVDPGGIIKREGLGLVSGTYNQVVLDTLQLVNDRSLNCKMGTKAQEYVRRAHSMQTVCQALEQIVHGFQEKQGLC